VICLVKTIRLVKRLEGKPLSPFHSLFFMVREMVDEEHKKTTIIIFDSEYSHEWDMYLSEEELKTLKKIVFMSKGSMIIVEDDSNEQG